MDRLYIRGLKEGEFAADDDDEYDRGFAYDAPLTRHEHQHVPFCLDNAYVNELRVCFSCGPLLPYLREPSDALRCLVSTVSTICANDHAVSVDNQLVRFVADKLKPAICVACSDA